MHFGAHVMGHQAYDPLAVFGSQLATRALEAGAQPVQPKLAVRIEHHFDDFGVIEPASNARAEGCAQHPGAAHEDLIADRGDRHRTLPFSAGWP
jgi:hypothetical protein